MRTPTPIIPRNSALFSQSARAVCDNDSATNACAQPPTAALVSAGSCAWPRSLHRVVEHGAHSDGPLWPSAQVRRYRPCQHRDVPSADPGPGAARLQCGPVSAPRVSRREPAHRWRLSIAGFHARRQANFSCSHFFPRSVGLGPTVSCAKGALTIEPSMLCQAQAMPSISLYSANPFRHNRMNTSWRFHAWKYLWIELALPKRSSGRAFHWHPVRNAYTIPSNTFRVSSGLRPPPGFRLYFRRFSRFRSGINGSTLAHIASDTVHDLIALMLRDSARKTPG